MIRKVSDQLSMISIDFESYVLLIYYHSTNQYLRLKVLLHNAILKFDEKKKYYMNDFSYQKLPQPIRINFTNLKDIVEEISQYPKDKFKFQIQFQTLRVSMQIGMKTKYCLFNLDIQPYTYLEHVEYMLWQSERNYEKNSEDSHQNQTINQILQINLKHAEQINELKSLYRSERNQRLKLMQDYQACINQLRTQIYELKMNYEVVEQQSQKSDKIPTFNRNAIETSSLICEQTRVVIDFINVDEEQILKKIERLNNVKLIKFQLDLYNGSDPYHAFERNGQKIKFKKRNLKHFQFVSLLPARNPILVNFKLIKTAQHIIYVGVLLSQRSKLQSTRKQQLTISYKLSGELYEDGQRVRSQQIPKVLPGEILSLFIDSQKNKVQWWKSGYLIIERQIPYTLRKKQLYPFVDMVNFGDCVQFA